MLKTNLPVLIVCDTILFPHAEIKLEFDDIESKKVLSLSESYFNNYLLIVYNESNNVNKETLDKTGVIAQIKFKIDMSNSRTKVSLIGVNRGRVFDYNYENGVYNASVTNFIIPITNPEEELASVRVINDIFEQYLDSKKSLGNSILSQLNGVNTTSELTDIIAFFMPLTNIRKVQYIHEYNSKNRVGMLLDDLHYELSLVQYENSLDDLVEKNLDDNQKEFILREKLKVINQELGISNDKDDGILEEKLNNIDAPSNIKERINNEINRYKLCNDNSPEIGLLRNYIDILLSLPWNKSSVDNLDIEEIEEVLNNSHYGLDEVKKRIIEHMATKNYTMSQHNPIICFVGPPGVGKTSFAKTIAKALRRECVKISLGGINDEAEITGHRRSYVGAAPGKIITGLIKAGVNNPVFIIDEIDKMTKDIKGDPASSLLEVLDREQNNCFVDHFIEEEVDLSKVMFILTANYIDKIPNELKDRLEIIELSSYTSLEKLKIVKNYLMKKLCIEYNLTEDETNLSDENILKIINGYTRESGIRELERIIRKLFRKYIYDKLKGQESVLNDSIDLYLGIPRYSNTDNYNNTVGVVNALSYTTYGGELVKVESVYYPGTGKFTSSGYLGDIFKESIMVISAYLKSRCHDFDIKLEDIINNDFHINLPRFAMKKDGSSASVVVITSLISLLKNVTINSNVSLTGELTLSGKILKIGGLKEKIVTALSNDIKTIYLPLDNKNEALKLEDLYKDKIKIVFVDNYIEVYRSLFQKKR